MDSLNTKPILDQIHQDASQAADKLLNEARDRAATILEVSSRRLQDMAEETRAQAGAEADVLEDRLLRLAGLEHRKDAVSAKRGLIDQAFEAALQQLNASPKEAVAEVIGDLLVKYAAGDETLEAGAVNDAYFTPEFVQGVNERLARQGKPGQLQASARRRPGVCGVVLQGKNSEMNCTFEALMDIRREGLESAVAGILFPRTDG